MRLRRFALACAGILALAACKDKAPSGAPSGAAPAPASAGGPAGSGGQALPAARAGLERDPSGHLKPHTARPPDNPADLPPQPKREPDWDLDASEPARDMVERFVRATLRYGKETACVEAKQTGTQAGKAVVEVRDAASPPAPECAASKKSGVRDVFLVDAGAGRLELGATKSKDLGKWPDGSSPLGPPNPPVDADAMKGPVFDALTQNKLTPIRAQLYGRGSYLVVTLAGWRAPITVNAPPDSLRPIAAALCAASNGLPMALFAGIDRSTMLRVRCGAQPSAAWDAL